MLLKYNSSVKYSVAKFLIEQIAGKVAAVALIIKGFFHISSFFKGNKSSVRSNLQQNYFCWGNVARPFVNIENAHFGRN